MKRPWVDWEGMEQRSLFEWAALSKIPTGADGASGLSVADLLVWIPNGVGKLRPAHARKLRDQGLTAGFPDLFLPMPLHGYHGLFVELKASRGHSAPVTEKQRLWIRRLVYLGYAAGVAFGWQEAASQISAYLTGDWVPE